MISPMLSMTAMGNVFARCKYTMPTIDLTRTTCEFTSTYALFEYLKAIGEQSAMHDGQRPKTDETFLAVSALMQTLFNMQTSPPSQDSSIHIDSLKDWYGQAGDLERIMQNDEDMAPLRRPPNIVSTFELVHLIGWKYHESQQKSKERGSAEFSLRQVVKDMNEEADDEDSKIRYGVLIDDGDEVHEE